MGDSCKSFVGSCVIILFKTILSIIYSCIVVLEIGQVNQASNWAS